ncbi:hypothetical protein FHS01_004346 [Longimicrobium terrae]|uniref:Uncharacterized protein n=1 Tax=Longimicrobium terrae TaxID=1639882 RepID=A0A841H417_9BACT|nr:hypothetical protein [Longimicrobium terrae]MBB6072646.1 hypothetical protein [Longimicrobium terrae]
MIPRPHGPTCRIERSGARAYADSMQQNRRTDRGRGTGFGSPDGGMKGGIDLESRRGACRTVWPSPRVLRTTTLSHERMWEREHTPTAVRCGRWASVSIPGLAGPSPGPSPCKLPHGEGRTATTLRSGWCCAAGEAPSPRPSPPLRGRKGDLIAALDCGAGSVNPMRLKPRTGRASGRCRGFPLFERRIHSLSRWGPAGEAHRNAIGAAPCSGAAPIIIIPLSTAFRQAPVDQRPPGTQLLLRRFTSG